MNGVVLWLCCLVLSLACAPADPSTGLYVDDTSTAGTETGSVCEPYLTLTAALSLLEAGTGGIVIIASTASAPVFGAVTLSKPVEIKGNSRTLKANGGITTTAAFTMSDVTVTQGTLATSYFLIVSSTTTLTKITVSSFSVSCIQITAGTFALTESIFTSNTATCIALTEFGVTFTDSKSVFTNNALGLEFKPSSSVNTSSVVALTSSSFVASPVNVEVSSALTTTGSHEFRLTQVTLTGTTGTLLTIKATNTLINLNSCTFTGGASFGISITLSGVAGRITNCTFSNFKSNALVVPSLKVGLTVSGCSFLNNNYGVYFTAIDSGITAIVTGCTFSGNKNTSTAGAGVFSSGGIIDINSSKFINNNGASGGGIYVTLGELFRITDTEISDTKSADYPALYCFRMKNAVHNNVRIKNVVSTNNLLTYSLNELISITGLKMENSTAEVSAIFVDGTSLASYYFCEFKNVVAKFGFFTISGRTGMQLEDTKFIGVSTPYIFYKVLLVSNCYRCVFQFTALHPETIIIEHTGSAGILDGCEFSGNFKAVTYGESQSAGCYVRNTYVHDGVVESLFGLNYYPLELTNITVTNVTMTKPLDYPLNQGTVTASNIVVSNSTGGFFFLQNSPLTLTNLTISNFGVSESSKFMQGAGSVVILTNVSVRNFVGNKEGSLFSLVDQSELTITNMTAYNFTMNDPGVILVQNSNLTISRMAAKDFTNTLFSVTGGFVTITDSSFYNGGPRTSGKKPVLGGFMYAKQCNSVWLENDIFSNMTADDGAVLYMVYTNPLKPSLAFKNSLNHFFVSRNSTYSNSVSRGSGGAVTISEGSGTIFDSSFSNNTSTNRGGGIYMGCSVTTNYKCYYSLTNTSFTNNSAVEGGGLSFYRTKPSFNNVTFFLNSATYGPDIASYPVRLGVIDTDLTEVPVVPYATVSGSTIPQPLLVALFDDNDQIVSTESTVSATLKAYNEDDTFLVGQASALASDGVFSYEDLIIVTTPGTNAELLATSLAIDYTQPDPNSNVTPSAFLFDFPVRDCILGEILIDNTCKTCEAGTYSLTFNSTFCSNCKTGMNCYSGSNVTIDSQYWRPGNMSDKLFKCPIKDICLDEEACDTGYKGRLCAECKSKYFRLGRFYCMPCGDATIGIVKGVFTTIGLILVLSFMIWSSLKAAEKGKSMSSVLFRIMINFTQVMMLLNNFDLSWPIQLTSYFDGLEFMGNTSQVAFSTECINDSGIKHVFVKQMFMAFLPVGCILISVTFWGTISAFKRNLDYLRQHCVCTLILLLLTLHPNILNSAFSMMSCKEMENNTWWLISDFSIKCWTGDHLTYTLSFSLPSLIIWGIITPVGFLVALVKNIGKVKDIGTRRRFSYLFNGYSEKRYYWEFIIVIRKSVIVALSMFLSAINSNVQSFTAILFIWCMLSVQYYLKPYSNKDLNNIEELSLATNIVTLYCGMYFDTDVGKDLFFYMILLTLTFMTNSLFFLYWIMFLLFSFKDKLEKIACLRPFLQRLAARFSKGSKLTSVAPDISKSYIYSPKGNYESEALKKDQSLDNSGNIEGNPLNVSKIEDS
jgi:predicted outer membrane repeat protein